jgi:putative ABC transport system permease protein
MDVYNAQKIFGPQGMVDRIDIALDDGANPVVVADRLRARLGGSFDVGPPTARAGTAARIHDGYIVAVRFAAVQGALVGGLVVFLAMWMSVVQRRRELGVLRAIGADRVSAIGLVAAESALLGMAGLALGIPFGIAAAVASFHVVRDTMASAFGPFQGGHAAIGGEILLFAV